ncbi:hypothetical protein COBT_001117 [Conglomerata obtusa]
MSQLGSSYQPNDIRSIQRIQKLSENFNVFSKKTIYLNAYKFTSLARLKRKVNVSAKGIQFFGYKENNMQELYIRKKRFVNNNNLKFDHLNVSEKHKKDAFFIEKNSEDKTIDFSDYEFLSRNKRTNRLIYHKIYKQKFALDTEFVENHEQNNTKKIKENRSILQNNCHNGNLYGLKFNVKYYKLINGGNYVFSIFNDENNTFISGYYRNLGEIIKDIDLYDTEILYKIYKNSQDLNDQNIIRDFKPCRYSIIFLYRSRLLTINKTKTRFIVFNLKQKSKDLNYANKVKQIENVCNPKKRKKLTFCCQKGAQIIAMIEIFPFIINHEVLSDAIQKCGDSKKFINIGLLIERSFNKDLT